MKDYKCPSFIKLGTGGDPYIWMAQMSTHFQGKGTWQFISEGEGLQVPENSDLTEEMITALCKRDILESLHPDVRNVVRTMEDPSEMYQRIVRMFVGSESAQRRKLREKC